MKPAAAVQNVRLQPAVFGLHRARPRHKDQVVALLQPLSVEPHDLPQTAPDTVAHDRLPQLLGDGKADAVGPEAIFPAVDHDAGTDSALPLRIDPAEVAVEFDACAGIQVIASHGPGKCRKGGLRRPVKHFQSAPFLLKSLTE